MNTVVEWQNLNFMYACMHVYMYICMHVYMYVCMYVRNIYVHDVFVLLQSTLCDTCILHNDYEEWTAFNTVDIITQFYRYVLVA